jgi:hypothetical protein
MNEGLLARLENQLDLVPTMLPDIEEKLVRTNIEKDKWSIFEQLAHIGRYHEVFIERIQSIVNNGNMVFTRYVAEDDIRHAVWCEKPYNMLLTDLRAKRIELLELLIGLDDEDIKKEAMHPVYGTLGIEAWVEFFLLHEAHHLFNIFKMAATIKNTTHKNEAPTT